MLPGDHPSSTSRVPLPEFRFPSSASRVPLPEFRFPSSASRVPLREHGALFAHFVRSRGLWTRNAIFNSEKRHNGVINRKPFLKRFDRKPPSDGVINRRNGCGAEVAVQRLCLIKTGILNLSATNIKN